MIDVRRRRRHLTEDLTTTALSRSLDVVADASRHTVWMTVTPDYFEHGCWDETAFAAALPELMDPLRVPYFAGALARHEIRGRLVEIGCGGGVTTSRLCRRGLNRIGLERSQSAVNEASSHVPESHFVCGSGEQMPFATGEIDAVVCSEVLEHLEEPAYAISEVGRVLRPGGLMLFSTPNRTLISRLVLIDIAQRWRLTSVLPADLHRWQSFIKPGELARMLDDEGMSIAELHGVGMSLRQALRAVRTMWLPKRGSLSYVEAAREVRLALSRFKAVAYIGYAVKR